VTAHLSLKEALAQELVIDARPLVLAKMPKRPPVVRARVKKAVDLESYRHVVRDAIEAFRADSNYGIEMAETASRIRERREEASPTL
jgi:hypothetical protein